jgi:hypothetical protein
MLLCPLDVLNREPWYGRGESRSQHRPLHDTLLCFGGAVADHSVTKPHVTTTKTASPCALALKLLM